MKKLLLFFLTLAIFSSCGEKTTADKMCDVMNETLDLVKEYNLENLSEKNFKKVMTPELQTKLEQAGKKYEEQTSELLKMWKKENPDLSENDLEDILMENCDAMKELKDIMDKIR